MKLSLTMFVLLVALVALSSATSNNPKEAKVERRLFGSVFKTIKNVAKKVGGVVGDGVTGAVGKVTSTVTGGAGLVAGSTVKLHSMIFKKKKSSNKAPSQTNHEPPKETKSVAVEPPKKDKPDTAVINKISAAVKKKKPKAKDVTDKFISRFGDLQDQLMELEGASSNPRLLEMLANIDMNTSTGAMRVIASFDYALTRYIRKLKKATEAKAEQLLSCVAEPYNKSPLCKRVGVSSKWAAFR